MSGRFCSDAFRCFFVKKFQWDQGIGNGLQTHGDGKLLSNFFESGVGSFGNEVLKEVLMRFEFGWKASFRLEKFKRTGFTKVAFRVFVA